MLESTPITLGQIFSAHNAWGTLISLPLPPGAAYKLARYTKRLLREVEIIEEKRNALVYKITGKDKTEKVVIQPGTPGFDEFVTSFSALLAVPSELPPIEMKFQDLLTTIDNGKLCITAADCEKLEPFFLP
jgi:hypothetical protein